ncbi:MAG TPA: hypothetical protein VGJ04_08760 [Pirellulales bacterium]
MSTRFRFYLTAGVSAAAALAVIAGTVYWASQRRPAFYCQALAQDPDAARQGSDALLHQAAALAGDLRRPGQWHALFTAEQINGWLAYDAHQNHPQLFPTYISDPRVAIENNRARVAFCWHKVPWSTVVSLETEVYLRQTNVVAVRVCRARAGILPLPLAGLLDDIAAAAREAGLQIDVDQIESDPLLLITLPWAQAGNASRPAEQLCLDSLEVNQGEIYVAGHTQRGQPASSTSRETDGNPQPAAHVENSNIQR